MYNTLYELYQYCYAKIALRNQLGNYSDLGYTHPRHNRWLVYVLV